MRMVSIRSVPSAGRIEDAIIGWDGHEWPTLCTNSKSGHRVSRGRFTSPASELMASVGMETTVRL
jgi:hypothetical protein